MIDVLGANYTKALTPTASNILDPGTLDGRVKVNIDTYEAAVLVSGSTIKMGKKLPIGAIRLGAQLVHDALGASSTLALGDGDDADRMIAAASSSAAGVKNDCLIAGMGRAVTGDDDDDITLITTGGASITGSITLIEFYTSN